jgi:hypothetical protein
VKSLRQLKGKKDMSEQMSMTDKVVNRHMARLLSELEQANCPAIYVEAVKGKLVWLRDDLNKMETERHEPIHPR